MASRVTLCFQRPPPPATVLPRRPRDDPGSLGELLAPGLERALARRPH